MTQPQRRTATVYDEQRARLLAQLRQRGITDEAVLHAMDRIPREDFVGQAIAARAYEDTALPIDAQQTISQPYTVAIMTQELHLPPRGKVLEIGTGSGYQAAVLAVMGMRVYTIERHPDLSVRARQVLARHGLQVECRIGDGTIGWREHAPYDGIIVTAGAPDVPETLARQLTIGGRLLVPVGTQQEQTLYRVTRTGDEDWKVEDLGPFKFVPLIGREGWDDRQR
jgi:protein-L-isoaspartate(D-aspartate) O-methyltransferase